MSKRRIQRKSRRTRVQKTHSVRRYIPTPYVEVLPREVSVVIASVPVPAARKKEASAVMMWLSAAIVVFLLAFSFGRIGSTVSYFSDIDRSSGNRFLASILDFIVSANTSVEAYVGFEHGGGATMVPVLTPLPETSGLTYRVFAEKIAGKDLFCNSIHMLSTSSPFAYNGPLSGLSTSATTTIGEGAFALSLPSVVPGIAQGDLCYVDLVYRGWQEGAAEGQGYTDEERVRLTLRARTIVINEFLPDPEGVAYNYDFGDDAGTKPQGEWVEMYNNSNTSVNLNGWYVWDASGVVGDKVFITATDTLGGTTVIPANGWLVIYLNKALLDNAGDEVRLYNASGALIDVFPYGDHDVCELEPTPGSTNDSVGVLGACAPVPPNKSYARIPDGLGPRIDPVPTPGFTNSETFDAEAAPEALADEPTPAPFVIEENATTTLDIATTTTSTSTPKVFPAETPEPVEGDTATSTSAADVPTQIPPPAENGGAETPAEEPAEEPASEPAPVEGTENTEETAEPTPPPPPPAEPLPEPEPVAPPPLPEETVVETPPAETPPPPPPETPPSE